MASNRSMIVGLAAAALIAWACHRIQADSVAAARVEQRRNDDGVLLFEAGWDSSGRAHGWHRLYSETGELKNERSFDHGVLQYQATYWANGNPQNRTVKGFWSDSVEDFDLEGNLLRRYER